MKLPLTQSFGSGCDKQILSLCDFLITVPILWQGRVFNGNSTFILTKNSEKIIHDIF